MIGDRNTMQPCTIFNVFLSIICIIIHKISTWLETNAFTTFNLASKSHATSTVNQAYQQLCQSKDSKRDDSKSKKIRNFVKDNIKNISTIRDSRMQKSQYSFQKSLSHMDANMHTIHVVTAKEINPKVSEYKSFIKRQKNIKSTSTSQSAEGNKSYSNYRRSIALNKDMSNCDTTSKPQNEQVLVKTSLKGMILQMQHRQKPHRNKENMSFVVVSNTVQWNSKLKTNRPSFGGWRNR